MKRYIYYYHVNGYIVRDIARGMQLTHPTSRDSARKRADKLNEADRKYRSVTMMIGGKLVTVGGKDG